jgi:hypothetical protein
MAKHANQSNVWDYTVATEKMYTEDGKDTGWLCNRRQDTQEVLGVCTEQYGLVNNRDLFGAADDAFTSRGMTPTKKEIIVSDGGARVRGVYDFLDRQIKVPQVGDLLGLRLIVNNSFDRSMRLAFILGYVRLVCTNGMQSLQAEFNLTKRHSKRTSIEDLITDTALDNALDTFNKTGDIFSKLAQVKLEQEKGLNILQNLTKKNVMSEKVREGIAQVWNNPKYEEDSDRNLYNLYNATTQHLTEEVAPERFEYSQRISGNVLKAFEAAYSKSSLLDKLVKPIEDPAIKIENN